MTTKEIAQSPEVRKRLAEVRQLLYDFHVLQVCCMEPDSTVSTLLLWHYMDGRAGKVMGDSITGNLDIVALIDLSSIPAVDYKVYDKPRGPFQSAALETVKMLNRQRQLKLF